MKKTEARHDAIVEVDELVLGQPVNVDLHRVLLLLKAKRRLPLGSIPVLLQ
jgi:hypothetical protein